MSAVNIKKILVFLWIMILTGCASKIPAPVENQSYEYKKSSEEKKKETGCPDVYKLKKGETLFSISIKCGFNYKEVARVNGLSKPYRIKEGDEIRFDLLKDQPSKEKIDVLEESTETIPLNDEAIEIEAEEFQGYGTPTPIEDPKVIREVYSKQSLKQTSKIVSAKTKLEKIWSWPTEGNVENPFDSNSPIKGVEILGDFGQEIKSVSKGKVIYAGEDLKGYGRLIIIKHDNDLLSVYGHNEEIFVREGQTVEALEAIGTMGSTGTDRVKLYFEIRKGGQSVNPLLYIKK